MWFATYLFSTMTIYELFVILHCFLYIIYTNTVFMNCLLPLLFVIHHIYQYQYYNSRGPLFFVHPLYIIVQSSQYSPTTTPSPMFWPGQSWLQRDSGGLANCPILISTVRVYLVSEILMLTVYQDYQDILSNTCHLVQEPYHRKNCMPLLHQFVLLGMATQFGSRPLPLTESC